MKILISAYSCEPGAGSEPGAGWAWACAAAQRHEVHLFTRTANQKAIDAELSARPVPTLHPVYLDLWPLPRQLKHLPGGVYLYYVGWQLLALSEGRALHRREHFDVLHHLTFSADWLPAGVAWIKEVPLVWGPVGGAGSVPLNLWKWLGLRGMTTEATRRTFVSIMRRLFADHVARRASVVICQNREVAGRFSFAQRVAVEPHVALQPGVARAQGGSPTGPRTAVFAGRLLPWKGLRLALAALARPEAEQWTLVVYGSGTERRALEQIAERLGVADRVRFAGARARAEVLRALTSAHALLFPSMHEAAGWIVAEAVAAGVPVVCLKLGGPAVIVGDCEGAQVEITERDLPGALAHELAAVGRAGPGSTRWSAARLPEILDSWYGEAAWSATHRNETHASA